jgi:hypothetical protein
VNTDYVKRSQSKAITLIVFDLLASSLSKVRLANLAGSMMIDGFRPPLNDDLIASCLVEANL